jgi:peroxiredoxin
MKALFITLICMLAVSTATAQAPKTHLKVGDKAPDFTLLNGDGNEVRLSELTPRTPILLIFYRGYW